MGSQLPRIHALVNMRGPTCGQWDTLPRTATRLMVANRQGIRSNGRRPHRMPVASPDTLFLDSPAGGTRRQTLYSSIPRPAARSTFGTAVSAAQQATDCRAFAHSGAGILGRATAQSSRVPTDCGLRRTFVGRCRTRHLSSAKRNTASRFALRARCGGLLASVLGRLPPVGYLERWLNPSVAEISL